MSKAIFITGDRQFAGIYPPLVLTELIRAYGQDSVVMTGVNTGVEQFVREVTDTLEVPVMVVENVQGEDGKTDWAARAAALPVDTHVVIIHADPFESSVYKGTAGALDESRVTLRTLADLMG